MGESFSVQDVTISIERFVSIYAERSLGREKEPLWLQLRDEFYTTRVSQLDVATGRNGDLRYNLSSL